MIGWLVLVVILLLLVAVFCSSLGLSLHAYSPSAVQRYLEGRDSARSGDWLTNRLDGAIFSIALVRLAASAAIVLLVARLAIGELAQDSALWPRLIIAGVIAAPLLWICNSVIPRAVARYLAVELIAATLPLIHLLTLAFWPLTAAVRFIDETVRRLSGAERRTIEEETEQRLLQGIEDTQYFGELDSEAKQMLANVVEFRSTDVGEVMTPRTEIEGIEIDTDLDSIRDFIVEAGHSRIPVYRENLDHIEGILYVKDLVPYLGRDADEFALQKLLRKVILVPETKPVSDLLADFQQSEVHMAIVVDEYGGTAGLVTIEDVLEEIVGEIVDEHEPDDEEEPAIVTIDDTHIEVDGRFHIDDLNEQLNLDLPEDQEFDTIAGFVLSRLGHVPEVGESFEIEQARFTALAATSTQVEKIGIELLSPSLNGHLMEPADAEQQELQDQHQRESTNGK